MFAIILSSCKFLIIQANKAKLENRGGLDKQYYNLEEYVNGEFQTEEEFDKYLIESRLVKIKEYIEKYCFEGFLTNPNGEKTELISTNTFNKNEEYFKITQNGEYKFVFENYDGRKGEIIVNINENEPQLVTYSSFYYSSFAIMTGYGTFSNIEKANIKIEYIEVNNESLEVNNNINLVPYIKEDNSGYTEGTESINFFDVPELYGRRFYGELTAKSNGKEIKMSDWFSVIPE